MGNSSIPKDAVLVGKVIASDDEHVKDWIRQGHLAPEDYWPERVRILAVREAHAYRLASWYLRNAERKVYGPIYPIVTAWRNLKYKLRLRLELWRRKHG